MASIKRNDGRCIRGSLMYVKHFKDKVSSYKPFDEGEVLYAEGVTSIAPISLHAWNVIHNARHQLVMDSTWSIKHLDPQDVWYHGVIFDPEFFEDIWLRQKEQRGLTSLPYLKSGYSILTCHELLNGQFDEYPITLEDCWNAIESIVPFRIAAVNQNKAYKKLAA